MIRARSVIHSASLHCQLHNLWGVYLVHAPSLPPFLGFGDEPGRIRISILIWGQNRFPPPEKNALAMGCADTVHFPREPNTGRSDSANFVPLEPIFCPQILEPNDEHGAGILELRLRESFLGECFGPLSSWRGPQTALKRSYHGDSVARERPVAF